MADLAGELGGETKVRRHRLRPACHGGGCGAGVEGGIAFDRVEHLAVQAKVLSGSGIGGVQVVAPGVFAP
ncbi:hypothetical protein D3C80_1665970 [compost metagenome]